MKKIKIGILGYGNLGKGVESAIKDNVDMDLVAIFTRREPKNVKSVIGTQVLSINELEAFKDKIDVMIICGGSKNDLPVQTPKLAKMFNVIDSFDTHAKIWEHFKNVDKSATAGNKLALISCGWDPGVFSLVRLFSESILPNGKTYTFWGPGVSQGHSDAIRKVSGVQNGIQYTLPIEEAINRIRNGETPSFLTREMHKRDCYVSLKEDANPTEIAEKIKNMPYYFADYDTTVNFTTEEDIIAKRLKLPHGGFVIRTGKTGLNAESNQIIEYSLKLDSNPEFTASIILAYARALYKLFLSGEKGAKTVFDIPPILLTNKTNEELLKNLL